MSTRDEWVDRYAPGRSKTMLKRIIRDGPALTGDGRRGMTEHTATTILRLVEDSGVRNGPGRIYLIDLLRWHLGYENAPTPTGNLTTADYDFIRRRSYELIDGARHALPAIERDRPAT